jgi:hypothetical protein
MAKNQDTINDYVRELNKFFLSPESHYDPATKEYLVGAFWVHEGLDYFEIRRVNDVKGDYSIVGNGEQSEEECIATLAGVLDGYRLTLDLLDMEFTENELDEAGVDADSELTDEQKVEMKALMKRVSEEGIARDAQEGAN